MKQVFDFQEPYYNLRSETSQFRRENIKATHYGIQSVKFLGPKIWAMVPQNVKNFFFWLALITHNYYLVWAIVFLS